jgi:parallel beta-helix repeat protein
MALVVGLAVPCAAPLARANTYTVTNTNNSGTGSLRDAIKSANNNPGADTIAFNLSGSGPFVIKPTAALPTLSGTVTIDGTSQPGYAGSPLIELDGSSIPATDGVRVGATDCTVKGLIIHSYSNGVRVSAKNAVVSDCWLGVDASGSTAKGNSDGVFVDAADCQVLRCVLSGNSHDGLEVSSAGLRCIVQDNYCGLDSTGMSAVSNVNHGMTVYATDTQILDNTISGNQGQNLAIDHIAVRALVQRNILGLDATGTFAVSPKTIGVAAYCADSQFLDNVASGNNNEGIYLGSGAARCTVQGNLAGVDATGATAIANGVGISINDVDCQVLDNVASGNVGQGIFVSPVALRTVLQRNYLGVDATGKLAIPNGTHGVEVDAADSQVLDNIASGNVQVGIWVLSTALRALVQGNLVGVDVGGASAIANGQGVNIDADDCSVLDNVVANTLSDGVALRSCNRAFVSGNVISQNSHSGVVVTGLYGGPAGTQNEILQNSIHHNRWNGISLNSGGNNDQRSPVLTCAWNGGPNLHVIGSVDFGSSGKLKTYHVELFWNSTSDAEGEVYLGFVDVTTDKHGKASFSAVFAGNVPSFLPVTATATDPSGNTSGFSPPARVDVFPPPMNK